MVDQESGTYRPRRAFIEPDPEPAPPPPPAATPRPPVVEEPRAGAPTGSARPAPDLVDEDAPKPLYRDEFTPRPLYREEPSAIGQEMSDDTAGRSITFVPRPRPSDDDATAILTRSRTPSGRSRSLNGRGGPGDIDDFDDFDSDEERRPRAERTRWALALGAVAAVVVVGLAIGYALFGVDIKQGTGPSPSASAGTTAPTTGTSGEPSATSGVLLTDESMLSAAQAKRLDSKRTWKVVLNQRGASEEAPVAACFGTEPEDGQPVSQQKFLRVLAASGKSSPSVLHDATAYATTEEAVQAYTVAARTLGTCAAPGAWLASGRVVRGVGDQSASAMVAVLNGAATSSHSVIVSRTGRVVNILDASRPSDVIPVQNTAAALAEVTKVQCAAAGGKCAGDVQVKPGPPPLGGDEPGYLAAGDLPPTGGSLTPWNAAPIELPSEDFTGASCETVNWATVPAVNRSTRVYLQPDSGKSYFGVNEILVTTKSPKEATALVDKIKKDLETCKERRLTATVEDPERVRGVGARNTEVDGYTAVVEQKRSQGSDKFRVGIVAAGSKVVYTFANPDGNFDFTDKQWDTIAVRAGERVTQVTT
jgi:hypothetical protein